MFFCIIKDIILSEGVMTEDQKKEIQDKILEKKDEMDKLQKSIIYEIDGVMFLDKKDQSKQRQKNIEKKMKIKDLQEEIKELEEILKNL